MKPNPSAIFRSSVVFSSLVALSCWSGTASVRAADFYWDSNSTTAGAGTAATGNWGTSNFWNTDPTGGAVGTFSTSIGITDNAVFCAGTDATSGTVTLNANTTIGNLTIEEGGLTMVSATSAKNLTVNSNVTFNKSIVIGSSTATTSVNLLLGTNSLTQTGGTLDLYGANSMASATLKGGSSFIGNASALGAGTVTIGDTTANSTYTMNPRSVTFARPIILDSGTFTNTTTIVNTSFQTSNMQSAVTSAGTGARTLNINSVATTGAGTMNWSVGSINHTGTLNLQNTRNGGSATNGTLTVSSVIGSNVTNVNVNNTASSGTQTVALSGANTYTGTTTVNTNAKLILGADNVIPDGSGKGNLVVNGTLDLRTTTAASAETINGLSGSGTITRSGATGTSTLTIGANNTAASFAGAIQNTAGTVAITKTGTNTLTLTGANSYSGATSINNGTLLAGNATALGTGTVTVGSATAASLFANGAFSISNAIQINANPSTGSHTLGGNTDNTSTFSGAILLAGNAIISQVATTIGNSLNLTGGISSNNTQTQTLTFAGPGKINVATNPITNGATGTVAVKVTGGDITFSAANTYTGTTRVEAGSLTLTQPMLADVSSVELVTGGSLVLNFEGTDSVGNLIIDGTAQYSDTWGAPGSGADHETALISGTGKLLVVPSEYIWTNTGSDGKWATASNSNVSQIPTTGVLLRFPSATDTSMVNDLPDLASVGKLRFESDAPAYTISGSNTLGITQGIENLSANIQTLGFPISLQAITQFTTSAGEILLNGNISGNYGFSKLGSGVLALAGTNTYTGNIGISGGTLATLAADALPPTSTVAFTNTTGTAGLDLTGRTQTLSGLTFGTQTTGTNTVTITGNSSTSLTVSPATLTFAPLNSASNLTVNMSSLGTFTYNNTGGTLNINGGSSAITSTGHFTTLTLPTTANNITALNLNVGNSGSSNGVAVSTLNLGTTANLNVTNLGIGNSNSRASGTLKAGSGTLTIRGATGGTSAATLTLGSSDSYQVSDTTTAVFDASAGTLDALFSDVTIGRDVFGGAARGVTINATLKMGAGSISANTLTLANLGGTYTGAGSYSITSLLDLNGTGTTTVTNLKLAHNSSITSPATVVLNSQVNLNGGATLKAAYVQQGTVTGVTTLTSRINWANGTIANIPGGDLTISGVAIVLGGTATHAFDISAGQTATVSAAISSLSGSTPLTKSGSGTLTLSGPNTYVGTTTVAAGTLETTTPFFDDASAVEIAAAAVLKLSFSGTDIVGSLTINGVPMTSGTTYGATGSGAAVIDNIHFSGTAKLQVGLIIDPFISWIGSSAFGLATADQGKTQDPDGDGLNNLLEFAIDGNPARGASSGKVVTKIDDSHLTLTLPIRDGASFTGGGPLVSATIDALVYMIEGDDDLSGFTSGVEEITALATGLPLLDKGWSYRTFRLTSTVNSAPRGFIRAGVSSAP